MSAKALSEEKRGEGNTVCNQHGSPLPSVNQSRCYGRKGLTNMGLNESYLEGRCNG